MVQLNAPDYDPDIDGQPDLVIDSTNLEQYAVLSTDTNRPQSQPSLALDDIDHPGYQEETHSRAEHPSDCCPQLEDIPELETDKENWEVGQLADADLIDHHNTTEESDRICHEYSAHFEKVTEQEYSPYHGTESGFEYQIPELEYYYFDTHPKQRY